MAAASQGDLENALELLSRALVAMREDYARQIVLAGRLVPVLDQVPGTWWTSRSRST